MADRTAIHTIKGYFYQFDKAILELLQLTDGSQSVTVEGIEDIDISSATENTAVQCKYYAGTEYNHSVIAKAIRFMLDHHKKVLDGSEPEIKYKFYGYFSSGQSKLPEIIDISFLKYNFLTYTEKAVPFKHHETLNINDKGLEAFISNLKIDINATEYEQQIDNILLLIKTKFNCNDFEASNFYYNNSLKVIKDISIKSDIVERKITQDEFIKKINFKKALFHEWYLIYKGELSHFRNLRQEYFTSLNISPFERFFLIEVPIMNYNRPELKDIIHAISSKWSKISKRDKPKFCPYIYLHGIPSSELVAIKRELYEENFTFSDGFDFVGAEFDPKALLREFDEKRPLKIKIVNELDHISLIISNAPRTKEIYQFYSTSTFLNSTYTNIKCISIQIPQLSSIKKII